MKILLKNIAKIFPKVVKVTFTTTALLTLSNISFAGEKSYYELQSELIYSFIDHVNWGNKSNDQIKNLCIMYDNPVIPYIKVLVANGKKNIEITRKYENDYLEDCNILFVNDVYDGYLNRLLTRVKAKPILTFGSDKRFAEIGGIVQFRLRNNRVEFTINVKEMKLSKIKIDDPILMISDTIN